MRLKFRVFLLSGTFATAFAVAGALASSGGGGFKTVIAEGDTHTHTASCEIHHYAEVAPTASTSGVKEYWICCNDATHQVEFSAPTTGNVSDLTHSDFTVAENDARYIAPYTFPEVFKTKYAYTDGSVTIGSTGEVVSSTGSIYIKGSIIKEAYSAGYTHMRFHSKADSPDAVQVLGMQDTWDKYFKRYVNDNDNRYWLKSFSDANQGLSIASQNAAGSNVTTNLTLSDFHLYKSSVTESWSTGSIGEAGAKGSWPGTAACNTYIAYEDGELVADNAGGDNNNTAIEIPESLMGSSSSVYDDSTSKARAFYVKQLASGYSNGANTETRVVLPNASNTAVGYEFKNTIDSSEKKTADGFVSPLYGGFAATFGLNDGNYKDGALSIGFDHPAAFAIRINYDFNVAWHDGTSKLTNYDIVPLANTSDGKMRLSIDNLTTCAAGAQFNIKLPKSASYKGINLKITSTVLPGDNFHLMDLAISKDLNWPWNDTNKQKNAEGLYVADIGDITFEEGKGCSIIASVAEAVADGTICFEYSWIA